MNSYGYLVSRHLAEGRGGRTAFREGGRAIAYAELEDASSRAAALLTAAGVGRGDRVLTFTGDTLPLVALVLGALRIGAVAVVGNHLSPAERMRFYVKDTAAKVVLLSSVSAAGLSPLAPGGPLCWYAGEGDAPEGVERLEALLQAVTPSAAILDLPADAPASWQYTHTADGEEIAVVHSHGAFVEGANPFARGRLSMGPDDVAFSMAKLYFGYGFGNTFVFPLATGASAILYSGRPDVFAVLDLVEKERPTLFFGVPTFYQTMLMLPGAATRWDLSSVRVWVSAGEELGASLMRRFHDTFGVWLVDGIGSTEMFHIFISAEPGKTRPGYLGTPTPGHDVRLLGPGGEQVPDGTPGELWVRGPHNGLGYAGHAGREARVFAGGWIKTGDRMIRDPDGQYRYVGRIDDMLMVGGQKVVLSEVRACLLAHASVADVEVHGVVDDDRITKLAARVRLKPGHEGGRKATLALRAHLRDRLLPHNWPGKLDIV